MYAKLVTNYLNIINVVGELGLGEGGIEGSRMLGCPQCGSARRLFFLNYSVLRTFLSFLELAYTEELSKAAVGLLTTISFNDKHISDIATSLHLS